MKNFALKRIVLSPSSVDAANLAAPVPDSSTTSGRSSSVVRFSSSTWGENISNISGPLITGPFLRHCQQVSLFYSIEMYILKYFFKLRLNFFETENKSIIQALDYQGSHAGCQTMSDTSSISEEERSLFRPFTRESLLAIESRIADELERQKELEKKRAEGEVSWIFQTQARMVFYIFHEFCSNSHQSFKLSSIYLIKSQIYRL